MPYVPVNVILDKRLTPNATITIPYPPNKTEGSFFGTFNHTMGVEDRFFRSPLDFIVIPHPDRLVMQWRSNVAIEQGTLIHLQLEELGTDFFFDQKTGVTVKGMVPSPTFMINLGTPIQEDPDYLLSPSIINSAGSLPLKTQQPDVGRTITITSTGDDSDCLFRIEGDDPYQRTMIEEIMGPNNGMVEGKKAFFKISRIIVSRACKGEVSIGIGRKLGLPVFLPVPGYVLDEVYNGQDIVGGEVLSGEVGIPSPTGGDRRGTYSPPRELTLDGKKALFLLVSLPNPGNIGSPDFDGRFITPAT